MKKLFTLITLSALLLAQTPAQAVLFAPWIAKPWMALSLTSIAAGTASSLSGGLLYSFKKELGTKLFSGGLGGIILGLGLMSALMASEDIVTHFYDKHMEKNRNLKTIASDMGTLTVNWAGIENFLHDPNHNKFTDSYAYDESRNIDIYTVTYTKQNNHLEIEVHDARDGSIKKDQTSYKSDDIVTTLQRLLCGSCSGSEN